MELSELGKSLENITSKSMINKDEVKILKWLEETKSEDWELYREGSNKYFDKKFCG